MRSSSDCSSSRSCSPGANTLQAQRHMGVSPDAQLSSTSAHQCACKARCCGLNILAQRIGRAINVPSGRKGRAPPQGGVGAATWRQVSAPVAPRHDDDAAARGAHPRQLPHKPRLVCNPGVCGCGCVWWGGEGGQGGSGQPRLLCRRHPCCIPPAQGCSGMREVYPPGMCSPLSMLHTRSNSPSGKGWFSASGAGRGMGQGVQDTGKELVGGWRHVL
jgi:hypothetical protein